MQRQRERRDIKVTDLLDPGLQSQYVYGKSDAESARVMSDGRSLRIRAETDAHILPDDVSSFFEQFVRDKRLLKGEIRPELCVTGKSQITIVDSEGTRVYINTGEVDGKPLFNIGITRREGLIAGDKKAMAELANSIHRMQQLK